MTVMNKFSNFGFVLRRIQTRCICVVENYNFRTVVVAQLAERLLSIPEVRGSNPVIDVLSIVLKIKKKRPSIAHF